MTVNEKRMPTFWASGIPHAPALAQFQDHYGLRRRDDMPALPALQSNRVFANKSRQINRLDFRSLDGFRRLGVFWCFHIFSWSGVMLGRYVKDSRITRILSSSSLVNELFPSFTSAILRDRSPALRSRSLELIRGRPFFRASQVYSALLKTVIPLVVFFSYFNAANMLKIERDVCTVFDFSFSILKHIVNLSG